MLRPLMQTIRKFWNRSAPNDSNKKRLNIISAKVSAGRRQKFSIAFIFVGFFLQYGRLAKVLANWGDKQKVV